MARLPTSLFLAYENDHLFELPVCVGTAREVSNFLGVRQDYLYTGCEKDFVFGMKYKVKRYELKK